MRHLQSGQYYAWVTVLGLLCGILVTRVFFKGSIGSFDPSLISDTGGSNCVLHPQPPGGSPKNKALNRLVSMDPKLPETLWKETTNAKQYNPNLKVFVAVGGWTSPDPGTANRQKFADNVVKCLNRHNFDGIDIDREYPGAPDRGGKPEDTANFYADWTKLMSYDLHGTRDYNNPIGAIAQAHINLIEIKFATELLWRVGGRPFELSDPTCTTPGCPFRGGAKAWPCSATSGVLMFYEIQAILKQIPGLRPVYDQEDAVKYIVWNKNHWVSYDDADTFGDKIQWANSIGIGGSMIWAVAHVDVAAAAQESMTATPAVVARSLAEDNGQDCKVLRDYECKPAKELWCGAGVTLVGWDRDGCSDGNEGKPICCLRATAPRKCVWCGSGSDCNGQCHPGEALIAYSAW
ncbi:bacteriodes thetaiotaomicron symbiotic chitinase [Podospora didyma]|uniref:chitinase n=1 Tax=Podospora didyma TaxID=330526 RepID=A0AAE0NUJ7_9PEZI|nr:bacteriodes thetaiotaomicron symbiotic chitinase [Podospora didyma]